jgi:protein dithiol oxidoreductase (disulfide-forming)
LTPKFKLLFAAALATLSWISQAEEVKPNWVEGTHYFKITPSLKVFSDSSKVQVNELFWYGCGHCFDFEPALKDWKKSINPSIEFIRTPAVFDHKWAPHARAFYTAKKLKILNDIHAELFNALHVRKEKIYNQKQLRAFFLKHGIKEDVFDEIYNSFEIDASLRKAMSLTRASGIGGVPSILINGQYRTSVRNTGSFESLLNVVDYLAAKETNK